MGLWLIWWDACGAFCFLFVSAQPSLARGALHEVSANHCLLLQGEAVVWFSNYVIVFKVLGPWFNWNGWGIFHFCVFETIILLVEGSHFRAMLTSPGVTQRNSVSTRSFRSFGSTTILICFRLLRRMLSRILQIRSGGPSLLDVSARSAKL